MYYLIWKVLITWEYLVGGHLEVRSLIIFKSCQVSHSANNVFCYLGAAGQGVQPRTITKKVHLVARGRDWTSTLNHLTIICFNKVNSENEMFSQPLLLYLPVKLPAFFLAHKWNSCVSLLTTSFTPLTSFLFCRSWYQPSGSYVWNILRHST